jgi:hypothetical protein
MLQTGTPSLTGGGVLAVVVTLLLTWLFYAVTLHLAATFFIGDVPTQLAAKAAIAPAVVSMLLQQWGVSSGLVSPSLGVLVVLVATVIADGMGISLSYRLSTKSTAPLVALHLAFAAVLGFALNNIFGLV